MLEELQRRNYASETIRGYILSVKQFAEYFGKSPEKMGAEEIRRFQLHLLQEKKLAPGTVEMRMSALRFLYKEVLKRRDLAYDDLIFPKTPPQAAGGAESAGSKAADRSGAQPAISNGADGSLQHGRSPHRGVPAESERHR
jgi:hypothetical protein